MALTKISTAMISQDASSVDLNIDAGTLYLDSTNNRVGVSNTSPATALDVTGTITADNIKLGDNQRVQIGDGQDFQFYHDGSNSYILATGGSGSLITRADVFGVQDSSNINMIEAASTTGVVTLYYNTGSTSAARLATSSTGVSITGNITTTGYIAGPATFTIDPAAVGDNTGTVVIAGNLQVDGTTTTINSTTMTVDDLNITLASGAANAAAANGAGITVDGASATITYDGTNDEWDFNKDINVTGTLTASGGSSNNDSTANILTLNASEHARLVVDTSSTSGHRATLAIKSNGNETQLTTTGSESFLNVASGNLTVDVAGDIVLDADGGDIFLRDAGSEFGRFQGSNQDWLIRNDTQDKDILIVGNDGGTVITALEFDMSEAGAATFSGAVNIPGFIAHVGDSNSFFGFPAGDEFRLELAGFERMTMNGSATTFNEDGQDRDFRVESTGNVNMLFIDAGNDRVGIGTASPNSLLQLETAATSAAGGLTLTNTNASGYSTVQFKNTGGTAQTYTLALGGSSSAFAQKLYIYDDTDSAARIVLDHNGYVGIGVTDPDQALIVKGVIETQASNSTNGWMMYTYTDNTFRLNYNGSGADEVVINSSGNVGIGTATPQKTFHIEHAAGASEGILISGASDTTGHTAGILLRAEGGESDSALRAKGGIFFERTGTFGIGKLHLANDIGSDNTSATISDARLTIGTSGNIGIGDSNPPSSVKLAIQADGIGLRLDGTSNTQKTIAFRNTGVSAPGEVHADGSLRFRTEDANTYIQFHTNSSGTDNERMIIKSDGKIGINQGSPAAYLHIKGTSDNQLMLEGSANNSNVGLFYRANGTDKWELYHRGTDNQFTLYSYTAGARVFVVDSAGKVGIGSNSLDPATSLDVTSAGEGGIRIKAATQIEYTPSSLSNFRQGLTLENAGSGHAFSIGYGQGGWLKFSFFDNSSTYTELARMESDGDFVPAGNVVLNDGQGVSFVATGNGNGSNSSELFDDYEEGTWTITLKDGTGNTYSGNYQSRNGRYTKVGRLVHATFELYVGQVDLTANGLSGNQGVRISGFPYNSNSSQFSGGVINNSNGINYTANSSICLAMARNVNEVMLRSFLPSTGAGESQITVTQFNNGNRLVYGTIMYEAS